MAKMTVRQIRAVISESLVVTYAGDRKERRRAKLQDLINDEIRVDHVSDQDRLDVLFSDMDMALKALKMVPYDVWAKLLKPSKRGG